MDRKTQLEDYWASSKDPETDMYKGEYPWPKEESQPAPNQSLLLRQMAWVETNKATQHLCYGFSWCRLCGDDKPNGSWEYSFAGFTWPSGLMHYIMKHNVRPSIAFQNMIANETKGQTLLETPQMIRREYFKRKDRFLRRLLRIQTTLAEKEERKDCRPCSLCGEKVNRALYHYKNLYWLGDLAHLILRHDDYPDKEMYNLVLMYGRRPSNHADQKPDVRGLTSGQSCLSM